MKILHTAVDWAKAEVFSAQFFILFGVLFILGTIGFWQLGKTEVAKAFVIPTLVAGILLLMVGFGIFFANKGRVKSFESEYQRDPSAFVQSEITRTEKVMKEYQNIVFRVIPLIVTVAALLIMFLDKPMWRAIGITTIGLMAVVLCIDSNAKARIEAYNQALVSIEKEPNN
ncbi:MAG: hypothetical protein AAFQ83_25195 [Bacteroidota bacterium]